MNAAEFWDSYQLDSAKGGHLNHYRRKGTVSAACGFQPKPKLKWGREMKFRHGWHGKRSFYSLCTACKERTDMEYRKSLLEESGDPRLVKRVVNRRNQGGGGLMTLDEARIASKIREGRSE